MMKGKVIQSINELHSFSLTEASALLGFVISSSEENSIPKFKIAACLAISKVY